MDEKDNLLEEQAETYEMDAERGKYDPKLLLPEIEEWKVGGLVLAKEAGNPELAEIKYIHRNLGMKIVWKDSGKESPWIRKKFRKNILKADEPVQNGKHGTLDLATRSQKQNLQV